MDLSRYNVPDLSKLTEQKRIADKYEELWGNEIDDLLPTEIAQIKALTVWAQRELENHYNTIPSLNAYCNKVNDKFENAGWCVFVDPYNVEEDTQGNPIIVPTIQVTGRKSSTEFDYDKATGEVRAGLLDGIEGSIDEHGNWKSPKKII